MTTLDEVAAYLATVTPSLGLITKARMPSSPDACLTLYEYGGRPPDEGLGVNGIQYEAPGVQLVARAGVEDYVTPRRLLERAYQALARVQGTTLSGTLYLMCRPVQSPFVLKLDEQARVYVAVNFICQKAPSAQ